MPRFQAILTDETGHGEFGVTIDADSRGAAWDELQEDYPECRVTQVLTQEEVEERENDRYARLFEEDPYDYYED